jgi:thioredoxin 1
MSQKTSFHDLIQSEKPVLIDFYADWCGPCKSYAMTIENFKHEVGDKVRVVKINVDKNEELSGQLQVRSIPTTMIFQNGELKWRAPGAQPIQTLKAQIEALV